MKLQGHDGNYIYGKFFIDVLHDEGIRTVEMSDEVDTLSFGSMESYELFLMLCACGSFAQAWLFQSS